jgi:hypothetical protein
MENGFIKLAQNEIPVFNDSFVEMVKAGQTKEAGVSAQSFTRNRLREESFAEKVITPIDINNDELDKAENPELLVKWNDREPDQAPAVSVPLGVVPDMYQFYGDRYPSYFARIVSPLFSKDIDKLRSYDYDIRQILLENSTKDIATEVDTKFMNKVNSVLGTQNSTSVSGFTNTPYSSLPNNITISGGITRENVAESFKVIQRLKVPFGPTQPDGSDTKGVMLMNNITAQEFVKMSRSEIGDDTPGETWRTGLASKTILGVKPIYTLKSDLVPDNVIYLFSSEEFFGKYYRLQPLTVFMETKAFYLQFFQYMNISLSIGNIRGVCRVEFT